MPYKKVLVISQIFFFLFFSFYLLKCPTSYERAQNTRLHHQLTRAILHIASLAAHTTLNTYNLWKLTLRGHLNTDVQAEIELGTFRSRERCLNRQATAPQNLLLGHIKRNIKYNNDFQRNVVERLVSIGPYFMFLVCPQVFHPIMAFKCYNHER